MFEKNFRIQFRPFRQSCQTGARACTSHRRRRQRSRDVFHRRVAIQSDPNFGPLTRPTVYLRMCTRGNPTSAISLAETFSGKLHPDQYVRAWLVYALAVTLPSAKRFRLMGFPPRDFTSLPPSSSLLQPP